MCHMFRRSPLPRCGRAGRLMRVVASFLCAAALAGAGMADEGGDVLGFADHLFKQRDYYRAITEYERFAYLFPTNPLVARARYSVALCYCNGGKLEAAIPELQSVRDRFPSAGEARESVLTLAEVQYRLGNYASAISALKDASTDHQGRALVLTGLCRLRMGDVDGAVESARKVPKDSDMRNSSGVLQCYARDMPGDEKSPLLAGILSAAVPGAGQLYVGRQRDAVLSFVLNGILVAGVAAALHNDEPVAAAALSVVEVAWYSGNIYGAANAAHKRNAAARQRFFGELEFRLKVLSDWTPSGASAKPALGVGLRF